MAQTSIMPTLVFSEELLASARALTDAAKRLKSLARSLQKKSLILLRTGIGLKSGKKQKEKLMKILRREDI